MVRGRRFELPNPFGTRFLMFDQLESGAFNLAWLPPQMKILSLSY